MSTQGAEKKEEMMSKWLHRREKTHGGKYALAAALAAGMLAPLLSQAQVSDNVIKVGVISDQTNLYADVTRLGQGVQ